MRVSTNQINTLAINGILDQQSKLSTIQNQLSTGKRVINPSDDPITAAKSISINQAISVTEQYQKNSDVATSRLNLEESTIESMTFVLNRVRELSLQGNNATATANDRKLIAGEMKGLQDELLSLANTRDSNGEYIYSGFQGSTQPFARDTAGGFVYSGDDGQRLIQVSPSRTIAIGDSGRDVFVEIRNGNGAFTVADNATNNGSGVIDNGSLSNGVSWVPDTYTIRFTSDTTFVVEDSGGAPVYSDNYVADALISFNGVNTSIKGTPLSGDTFTISPSLNQDLFTTVQNVIDAFTSPTNGSGTASVNNGVNRFLTDIDQAFENLHNVRAGVGARLNSLESQKSLNDAQIINDKQSLSDLIDVDYIEAISNLNLQQTGLEAAQKSYMKIQGLSLFNYL